MSPTALIVCAAPSPGTDAIVREAAAQADLVIGVDGGAAVCLSAGVRPDAVIGDLDSLAPALADGLRSDGVEFLVFPPHKDRTDLDLALDEVRVRGCTAAIITAAFSARLDHTLAAVGSVSRAAGLRPEIREPGQSGLVLSAAHLSTVTLEPEGVAFSVIAVNGPATVSITGAEWPLDRGDLAELESVGVSNVVSHDHATVVVHSGTILVWTPTARAPY